MASGNPLATQVMQALARGDKAGALRLMRDAGGPGLRQALQDFQAQAQQERAQATDRAKQAVQDAVATRLHVHPQPGLADRKRPPTVAMGDPPGAMRWFLLVVALVCAAVWVAFGGVA